MKVYSIGREFGCDIVIDDNTDVISRRHATLNVSPSGKMTIVDLSHNGTYVNGIRINQNVPVPVTRKVNISFAHVARLDWDQIPNTNAIIVKYALLGLLALMVIVGAIYLIGFTGSKPETPQPAPIAVDSTYMKKQEEKMKEEEKAKQDSIKKQVQDSLEKVRAKKQQPIGKKKSTKSEAKKSAEKKDTEKKATRIH